MVRLVVLDGYTVNPGDNPWTPLAELGELSIYDRSDATQVVARAAEADVVLLNKTQLSGALLAQLPKLRGISVLATGVNSVDLARATELGIVVCNVPSYSTATVAQHTIALLLELCHRTGLHDASVHAGDWQRSPDFCYWKSPLLELEGNGVKIDAAHFASLSREFEQKMLVAMKEATRIAGREFNLDSPKQLQRSEERRVGKECRSRWSPYH